MQRTTPLPTHLSDYKPPHYLIDHVDLVFELDDTATTVSSLLQVHANPEFKEVAKDLVLHGQDLQLEQIEINGVKLGPEAFTVTDTSLILKNVPEDFLLNIRTKINPTANTKLLGLYKSQGNFTTQCEAEGFRHITYFLDRPDVMSKHTTTIIADEEKYPILLSNGNLVSQSKLINGKHLIKWEDPFKKPSYLFALVAGDFELIEDNFLTQSGRNIKLQIYAEKGYGDRCAHAMKALKKAMKWDEENYGREYDLDVYKIVGVSDFNMGAMENKGLNIFNTKYILATPETATDEDFLDVESAVGHEYFHNWTGNRVSPRDWFQLSLKEGLTTFREQSFVEDISSVAARIQDVSALRNRQFAEDAGPLAHPVQPQSFIEIDNFYTTTIYKKGSELFRMLHTLLGKDLFRKGMDLYFERHDGQAVRIEEFLKTMEDVSKQDLSQFLLWFHQAGTPVLDIEDEYNAEKETYTLRVKQSCPATPGQLEKKPMMIPVKMGLLDEKGMPMPLHLEGSSTVENEKVVVVKNPTEEFHFTHVTSRPTPSLLRGFSAPVHLNYAYTNDALRLLSKSDPDLFNRYDAGRKYITDYLLQLISDHQNKKPVIISDEFFDTFNSFLKAKVDDLEIFSMMISLPTETELANKMKTVDPDAIHEVREFVSRVLAKTFSDSFLELYRKYHTAPDKDVPFNGKDAGKRSIKNTALQYLIKYGDYYAEGFARAVAFTQFKQSLSLNMTDTLAALTMLVDADTEERLYALDDFYKKWSKDQQVMDFWFSVQASSKLPDTLDRIKRLFEHTDFDFRNPNRLFSLLGPFIRNFSIFHAASGEGYKFLADIILKLDPINPISSAEAVVSLTKWKRYDLLRQNLMRKQLQRILQQKDISKNLFEIVSKSLEEPVLTMTQTISEALKTIATPVVLPKEEKKPAPETAKLIHSGLRSAVYGASIAGAATLALYGLYRFAKSASSSPIKEALPKIKPH